MYCHVFFGPQCIISRLNRGWRAGSVRLRMYVLSLAWRPLLTSQISAVISNAKLTATIASKLMYFNHFSCKYNLWSRNKPPMTIRRRCEGHVPNLGEICWKLWPVLRKREPQQTEYIYWIQNYSLGNKKGIWPVKNPASLEQNCLLARSSSQTYFHRNIP